MATDIEEAKKEAAKFIKVIDTLGSTDEYVDLILEGVMELSRQATDRRDVNGIQGTVMIMELLIALRDNETVEAMRREAGNRIHAIYSNVFYLYEKIEEDGSVSLEEVKRKAKEAATNVKTH